MLLLIISISSWWFYAILLNIIFVLYKFAKLVDLLTNLVDLLVRIQELLSTLHLNHHSINHQIVFMSIIYLSLLFIFLSPLSITLIAIIFYVNYFWFLFVIFLAFYRNSTYFVGSCQYWHNLILLFKIIMISNNYNIWYKSNLTIDKIGKL